ncbi:hypothetical protein [Bifidobacterium platyrrhinorum]|uniref:Uncharacterized protein n=1 Tax=Bifidobacterium platyrrhinorum TaxID=2661628 RepID=A0A6L9SRY0_9BIFI|nr:hypothetical protein [Bifidobacterium platyrrhinorum]NEG54809.1 hypothetical protein [Bifidobacterium platyrrhinorum]
MFENRNNFPCAVVDQDDVGERLALEWCNKYLKSGQHLTLWVAQKNILGNNKFLIRLSQHPQVDVVVARGSGYFASYGPVLAMYPRVGELGTIMATSGMTALCVVRWENSLSTWIKETGAEVLHEAGWKFPVEDNSELNPEILEELKNITLVINHNNTIAAGFEKKIVVTRLLRLHDDGVVLPRGVMMEWAAAHGWRGKNVDTLGEYVDKINAGVRPRTIR